MAEQNHRIEIDEDEVWVVRFIRGTHALTFELFKEETIRSETTLEQRGEGRLTWQGRMTLRFTEEIEFELPHPKKQLPLTLVFHEIFSLGPKHITNWDPQYGGEA